MIQISDNSIRSLYKVSHEFNESIKEIVNLRIDRYSNVDVITSFLKDNLTKILIGEPDILYATHVEFQNLLQINGINNVDEEIRRVFSYKYFCNNEKFNAYHLAKKLNIKVCVYCNRQYTFTVQSNNSNLIRPQFDHFFNQSEYPILALSFYNLIPCCSICNSSLKGKISFGINTHLNPYLGGYNDDFKFIFKGKSIAALEGLEDNYDIDFVLDRESENFEKIRSNAEVFKLKEIYAQHSDQIREIVRKYHISGGEYIIRLVHMFNLDRNDQEELYTLAFGNYNSLDKYELRPLAKFTHDIYKDVFLAEK